MKSEKNKIIMASSINMLAGIWIFLTPFIFGLTGTLFAINDYILGIIIFLIALIRVLYPFNTGWASWINAVLGFWLLLSPLTISESTSGAIWSSIIVGLVIIIAAISSYSITSMHFHPKAG